MKLNLVLFKSKLLFCICLFVIICKVEYSQCLPSNHIDINDEKDMEIGESIGKNFHSGGLDEGHHEEGSKKMYHGHHGERASKYGHEEHDMEKEKLDKGKAGHQMHHQGAHHKEIGKSVGHVDSKKRKNHDKILKHTWDRGGGFVKKWHWNKGGHLEEEHFDAEKKHQAHHGHHHHKEAAHKSKGQKANHHHHKEAHKKEHHKAAHGHEKKLKAGQSKEAAYHVKGAKRHHHMHHDDMDKHGHFGDGGFHHDSDYYKPYASARIGKYLQPRLNPTSFGEESIGYLGKISFDKEFMPFQKGIRKRDSIADKVYAKNWRYGHIFGDGLNFLLPNSDI